MSEETKSIIDQKVTKDMLLGDVIQVYPETAAVMLEYGLHCVGCFANQFDTVEQGALLHGMDQEEISEMLERVNDAIKSQASDKENNSASSL